MKILVTGSKGQLGSEIKHLHKAYDQHHFTFIDAEELDLGDGNAINEYFQNNSYDLIINCAAFTNVDGAEDKEELARKINADAPALIAEQCKEKNMRLIHISTDYVFDGEFNRPIIEEDSPCPQSVYGKTKLEGERYVLGILDNAYIVRTSWVYSSFGNNFVKTMLRLGKERDSLNVVSDQIGTPTYARDLAYAILTIIENLNKNDKPGIYHYSNEGVCSWYDFAFEIMQMTILCCKVNPIPTAEFPTKAKRPGFSLLDKSKIKSTFAIEIPYWKESLASCIKELTHE